MKKSVLPLFIPPYPGTDTKRFQPWNKPPSQIWNKFSTHGVENLKKRKFSIWYKFQTLIFRFGNRPILRNFFVFVNMGCFWKQAIFGKNSKGNPFENSILGPLFWTVLDARSFFWTFFEKCPFGGGDQKKVWFLHFFVKIEKISKFYHFPLTDQILDCFRDV